MADTAPEPTRGPVPLPETQPQPTQEQLLQDIQAEAAEKAAELRERRDIKDRAREVIDSETLARVEDERAAFRRDLGEAVKLSRREAAVQIDNLCDRYGRNYSEDLRSKASFLLGRYGGKMSREGKVRMLRLAGVPEPGILDFLANETHHLINSRSGPRDSNEVRVDAAKQLLRMKLVKDSDGESKTVLPLESPCRISALERRAWKCPGSLATIASATTMRRNRFALIFHAISGRGRFMRLSPRLTALLLTGLLLGPAPGRGDEIDASMKAGTKLLAGGRRLADEGKPGEAVIRYKSAFESSCPGCGRSPSSTRSSAT